MNKEESKVKEFFRNRYGGKGVVSNILPNNGYKQVKVDILLNYSTIYNRTATEDEEDIKQSRF